MRIDLKTLDRRPLFRIRIDPSSPPDSATHPHEPTQTIPLDWRGALDDHSHLSRCPACGCRELFVRRDFPQAVGMTIVALAALTALILFGFGQVAIGFLVLFSVVGVDAAISLFTGRCLVCYRCRSEFRDLAIRRDQPQWDLATGEKYRPQAGPDQPPPPQPAEPTLQQYPGAS